MFMPIVKDDFVLTCILATYSLANVIGAIFWGWISDKYGVAKGLLMLISIDIIVKLLSFKL